MVFLPHSSILWYAVNCSRVFCGEWDNLPINKIVIQEYNNFLLHAIKFSSNNRFLSKILWHPRTRFKQMLYGHWLWCFRRFCVEVVPLVKHGKHLSIFSNYLILKQKLPKLFLRQSNSDPARVKFPSWLHSPSLDLHSWLTAWLTLMYAEANSILL